MANENKKTNFVTYVKYDDHVTIKINGDNTKIYRNNKSVYSFTFTDDRVIGISPIISFILSGEIATFEVFQEKSITSEMLKFSILYLHKEEPLIKTIYGWLITYKKSVMDILYLRRKYGIVGFKRIIDLNVDDISGMVQFYERVEYRFNEKDVNKHNTGNGLSSKGV